MSPCPGQAARRAQQPGGDEVVRVLRQLTLGQDPDDAVDGGGGDDQQQHTTHQLEQTVEPLQDDA